MFLIYILPIFAQSTNRRAHHCATAHSCASRA